MISDQAEAMIDRINNQIGTVEKQTFDAKHVSELSSTIYCCLIEA